MATRVDRYIGSNGEILIPTTTTSNNTSALVSSNGVYYLPQTSEVVVIEAGNPIGLLLSLTYAG